MKLLSVIVGLSFCLAGNAQVATPATTIVRIPHMERPSLHRVYADGLLDKALKASSDKYGPYKIIQQEHEQVIERQLAQISANQLSVAVAMPKPEWLANARLIQFPIMKGFASYRLFFVMEENKKAIEAVTTLEDLKAFKVGQGRGWSTSDILEHHGFDVVHSPDYESLFPMLAANRYQILMRGAYEMEVELFANKYRMPKLAIADSIAVYTYLPMYFFVAKAQPVLAERIEYGLKKLHRSGEFDRYFKEHFWSALALLDADSRKVFKLTNSNIDASYYIHDKPYLLDYIDK